MLPDGEICVENARTDPEVSNSQTYMVTLPVVNDATTEATESVTGDPGAPGAPGVPGDPDVPAG